MSVAKFAEMRMLCWHKTFTQNIVCSTFAHFSSFTQFIGVMHLQSSFALAKADNILVLDRVVLRHPKVVSLTWSV